ncbi:hypothetical protein [Hansschlegelia zhihuaiae]|uniref:Uncharacterized protein n=1 Tax=Hansschlegelia zhihuaiae TaxID=405005 RepID=A0A4Q0MN29_9HYPH|nr:hypothetical protein [Hansschlegelia zhihuaiae]RXF75013.1 hypothetical protein EK403_02885 [Hansschlegelia zhihuaiae]
MARNLSLAIGRPAPSFGIREVIREARDALVLIAAAGRVGAAVEARQTPSPEDLKLSGLDKAEILRAPYRF